MRRTNVSSISALYNEWRGAGGEDLLHNTAHRSIIRAHLSVTIAGRHSDTLIFIRSPRLIPAKREIAAALVINRESEAEVRARRRAANMEEMLRIMYRLLTDPSQGRTLVPPKGPGDKGATVTQTSS